MKEQVFTEKGPTPKGPYSQGIITAGRQLYVAGQGPIDPATGQVVGKTFAEQAERTFENLKAIIEAAGASMGDVVKVNVYLSDIANFKTLNEIYRRYLPEPYPARTTVQAVLPGGMIEVDAIVALPEMGR